MTSSPAAALTQLAKAWVARGNLAAASATLERALQADPAHVPALLSLADLLVRQGYPTAALARSREALALRPDDPALQIRIDYLERLSGATTQALPSDYTPHQIMAVPPTGNPQGKIDLRDQIAFKPHRSGWAYALAALMPLHNDTGAQFDGFLERNFAWRHPTAGIRPAEVLNRLRREGTFDALATTEERGITPYLRPWVGIFHNPPNMPSWYHLQDSPQAILAKDIWQRSLPYCIGLFALSEYHARWLREHTGKPVSILIHTTEIPATQFSLDAFRANPRKKIVQVGWWLRRLAAIYNLPIAAGNPLGYEKIRLVPRFIADADRYLRQLMALEMAAEGIALDPLYAANTGEIQHLPDAEYDQLFAENIIFLDLYDSSANNAVVECIARATPLLVNPLPAVVEYLGPDYPFYFTTLAEAAAKAQDETLIAATHQYLATCPTRSRLNAAHFRQTFETSEVYQLL